MEDKFMLSWIGFINVHENIKFFRKEFPGKTDVINKLLLNHNKHLSRLADLCVVLGEERCMDLIGGVAFCRLLQNMKEEI